MRPPFFVASALALTLLLPGCDKLNAVMPGASKADIEAEGKAIGSACRHAGRAIEDCFTLNAKANKAAVFEGWREMNDYMTKNKIEVVAPVVPRDPPKPPPAPAPATAATPAEPAPEPAPPADEGKSRSRRTRSGQQADLPRGDSAVRMASAHAVEPDARAGLSDRAAGTSADRATAIGGHAPGAGGHGATNESRAPAAVGDRAPQRITAVGAAEIDRMKTYANTP